MLRRHGPAIMTHGSSLRIYVGDGPAIFADASNGGEETLRSQQSLGPGADRSGFLKNRDRTDKFRDALLQYANRKLKARGCAPKGCELPALAYGLLVIDNQTNNQTGRPQYRATDRGKLISGHTHKR